MLEFWQEAESAVANRRQDVEDELARLRAETDSLLQSELSRQRNNLLFEAQNQARIDRVQAEAAMAERLYLLATQMLPKLAQIDRQTLWQAFCAELPEADWRVFRVASADRQLAQRSFPQAEIVEDEALYGGLIASTADGTIRIDNSLSCRLMRFWPDLLPKLLNSLRTLVNDDEITHADTTF